MLIAQNSAHGFGQRIFLRETEIGNLYLSWIHFPAGTG